MLTKYPLKTLRNGGVIMAVFEKNKQVPDAVINCVSLATLSTAPNLLSLIETFHVFIKASISL